MHMGQRLKEWFIRYLPPEITGIIFGLGGAWLCHAFALNPVITAFVGTWAENLGFYLYAVSREARKYYLIHRGDGDATWKILWKTLRNLLLEFGVAEGVDSFIVRPFLLYEVPKYISNFTFAIFVGMMCANVAFYTLSIVGYEMRKRFIR